MSHAQRMTPLLSALLDGDLSRPRAYLVRRHLRRCAECQRLQQALTQQTSLLRGLSEVVPPQPEADRACAWLVLRRRLQRDAALGEATVPPLGARQRALRLAPLLLCAAAVALVVVNPTRDPRLSRGGPVNVDTRISIAEDEFRRAEEPYQRSLAHLQRLATQGGRAVDPEAAAAGQELAQATREAERAARRSPGDAAAQEALYQAYLREIDHWQGQLQGGAAVEAPRVVPVSFGGGR